MFRGVDPTVAACAMLGGAQLGRTSLGGSAVDEDGLTVDPAGGAGQERHGLGDVLRFTQPLERVVARDLLDQLWALTLQERRSCAGAGRDRVDGDVAAVQLTSQDQP